MSIKDIAKVSRNLFMTDVVEAIQKEIGVFQVDVEDIKSSMMILADEEKCTEWEKWFELEKEPTWSLEDRIDRLIYTFNSKGFFTEEFLKDQARIFTNGEIEVEQFYEDYHFVVRFTSMIGVPPNMDNFQKMVNINKPAHLTWEYKYRYRTHGELEPFTHEKLGDYTHEQLAESGQII